MKARSRQLLARPAAFLGVLAALFFAPLARSQVTYPMTPVGATQLVNLSVRTKLRTNQSLVLGFVITGDSNSTARILMRGIGPSLLLFGIRDSVVDPKMTLSVITPAGPLSIPNDDWASPSNVLVSTDRVKQLPIDQFYGAFPLSIFSKDAAILADLKPGSYTLTLTGFVPSDVGTILAEIYNVAVSRERGAAQLSNLSVLGYTDTDTPLLAGVVFDGSYTIEPTSGLTLPTTIGTNVLLRAVGPGLAGLGVSGTLADPLVELLDENGVRIQVNDNWDTSPYDEFYTRFFSLGAGAFSLASRSKDAALVATIRPKLLVPVSAQTNGTYTVRTIGAPGTSGTVLLEIYNLGIPEGQLPFFPLDSP
jgi:hypothetical protein